MSRTVIGGVVAAAVLLLGGFLYIGEYYSTDTHTGCVIEDKDRTRDAEGNSDMRIYTENCGTFQVSDSFVTDFKSADRFSKIKVGKTYDIQSYGFRVGILSMFPQIKDVTLVE